MDKVNSMLAIIALKEALTEDTSLHHDLVKCNVEDIDDTQLMAGRYIMLETIQKNKPVVYVATISPIPSRIDESRRLKGLVRPPKRKDGTANQPQNFDRKRRHDP